MSADAEAFRALLVRADSLLTLLWYRHVPRDRRSFYLEADVLQTIDLLRAAAARPPEEP